MFSYVLAEVLLISVCKKASGSVQGRHLKKLRGLCDGGKEQNYSVTKF